MEDTIPYAATYLEFIIKITEYVDIKLKEQSAMQFDKIKNVILSIVEKTFRNCNIVYSSTELISISTPETINILRDISLLKWLKTNNDILTLNDLEELYELYTKMYWVLKIVLFSEISSESYIKTYEQMSKFVGYKDELLPCFLLLLDYRSKSDAYCNIFTVLIQQHEFHYE